MRKNTETQILEAIQTIDQKVDTLSQQICQCNQKESNDEIVAVIAAAIYKIFGNRAAIRNVQLFKQPNK